MSKRRLIKSNKRFVVIAFSVLVTGLLIWWLASVISYQNTLNSQKQRLDEVATDLKKVYDEIVLHESENVLEKNFRYICYESSVKYGRGQMSCGPEADIIATGDYQNVNVLDKFAKEKAINTYFKIGKKIFNDETGDDKLSQSISGLHQSTGIYCSLSIIDGLLGSFKYHLSCSDRTIDILPGYVKAN